MWVRLVKKYINTDHIVFVTAQGEEESATGVRYFIKYATGEADDLSEREAQPLLEALSSLVDKTLLATDSNAAEV